MNPNCARCGKIVYPTEKVNCLDKFWHKACFHCETCKMTLNMKNYKGYEKKPYCNAHYPKQSFTMVADTPENLRLKQQSELQSQIRYKEEFEKNKGKGFSVVADTPELQRIKKTQDQISNIKYHEEFERSRMGPSPSEGSEPERRNSQESSGYRRAAEQQHQPQHHGQPGAPVYQQQQPPSQSYGYKEPAAPASTQRNAPAGGGKRFRAVYDYNAADEDEVSFQDGDTIINVQQIDDGWMYGTVERTGDTGMLPANYVEEIVGTQAQEQDEASSENSPLGNFLKGFIDVPSCHVVISKDGRSSKPFVFTIHSQQMSHAAQSLDVAADTQEELSEWVAKIREATQNADARMQEGKIMERRKKIALELSELVVYCRPVPFDEDKIGTDKACYRDMSSFPETKAEKYANRSKGKKFLQYNRRQLSRIYPKGQRLDSSNYDPLPMWICGSQLVALNFQTPDKPMQLNQALFMLGGRSGYVLQPDIMRDETFDPFDKNSLKIVEPITVQLQILGARHLPKNGRSIVCPFVEVEVCGSEYDNSKNKTDVVADNGFNPVWLFKQFVFDINNPEFAFLRFVVYEEDMFSDPNFLAQATFPVKGLKTGYRSVPLKNSYTEDLELASLLIHIEIINAKEEDEENLYSSIQQLRDRASELSSQVSGYERTNGCDSRYQQRLDELRAAQERLMELTEVRNRKLMEKKKRDRQMVTKRS